VREGTIVTKREELRNLLSAPVDDEPQAEEEREGVSSEPGASQAVERLTKKSFVSLVFVKLFH